jgi:hypothetical protein
MKVTFLRACALLSMSLMLGRGASADDPFQLTSNDDDPPASAAPNAVPASYTSGMATSDATSAQASAASCGCSGNANQCQPASDGCEGWLSSRFGRWFQRSCDLPESTCCNSIVGSGFTGLDSFRGIANGTYPSNNGAVSGFNLGGALLDSYGIGWQAGMSYGLYNFEGTSSPGSHLNASTQQAFVTIGVFRRADEDHRFSWGIVHDWMFTNNFGAFGNSPTLSQFRGQAAWALSAWNQVGVWSAIEDRTVTRSTGALGTPITYQAIDQANVFWDHQYGAFGATSRFSVGVPLRNRLDQVANGFPVGGYGGTLGGLILSTNWTAPVTDRMSLYANAMYMMPTAHAGVSTLGASAAAQEFWNVSVGLSFSPRGNLRSKTIAGRRLMPYLPVANNSSFLVDASKTE